MGSAISADAAARIKRVRTRIDLSQVQFATLLGVSNVTVNRWEHGRTHPMARRGRRSISFGSLLDTCLIMWYKCS